MVLIQWSPQPFHLYGWTCSSRAITESAFPTCWKEPSLLHSVLPDDMVNSESEVAVKPGDSGEVIWCDIVEFSCNWSVVIHC